MIRWLESCHQGEFSTGTHEEIEARLDAKGRPPRHMKDKPWWPDPRTALPKPPPVNATDDDLRAWFSEVCAVTDEILCLTNVHSKDHSLGCLKYPDFQCRARFPRWPLYDYSFIEGESGAIRMKKLEAWINTFNVLLTYLIRCNTDVTALMSGTMVRAVLAYVTDYVTKMSLKSYVVFQTILVVLRKNADLVRCDGDRAVMQQNC
ncbi:hypothetical protein EIP86_010740 [Pleurotus ostreatoroseus]|nr:hypothetical protein EIP86_010740 [Pleurotus ostreatoroseus]